MTMMSSVVVSMLSSSATPRQKIGDAEAEAILCRVLIAGIGHDQNARISLRNLGKVFVSIHKIGRNNSGAGLKSDYSSEPLSPLASLVLQIVLLHRQALAS
jgi:hypothetical protein